jgi:PTH1 family peptidyl-tRNA hydrolase
MLLFVGLGNPGPTYRFNRHNVGYMAVDAIHASHGFGPWRQRFHGEVAEGRMGAARLVLLKPLTFMNDSGRSVAEALRFLPVDQAGMVVFHDDLDLEPFRVKVKRGGGAAGQNGLRSIDAHVGPDYRRVRIGIGHPGHKERVTAHVLGNFGRSEQEPLAACLADIADLAPLLVAGEDARFMSELARRSQHG